MLFLLSWPQISYEGGDGRNHISGTTAHTVAGRGMGNESIMELAESFFFFLFSWGRKFVQAHIFGFDHPPLRGSCVGNVQGGQYKQSKTKIKNKI